MSIDVSKLAPWAQAQIAQKIVKQSKYRNQSATRGQIRFDSQKEARRYDELMLMLKAGKIRDLRLQPQFTLQEAYTTPDGNRIKATRYQADFSYERHNEDTPWLLEWERVVEDVKSKATKTRVYAIKKKMLMDRFGIEITEVE